MLLEDMLTRYSICRSARINSTMSSKVEDVTYVPKKLY